MMLRFNLGLQSWIQKRLDVLLWTLKGRPMPPPRLVKDWRLLREMGSKPFAAFVETGTYLGETVRLARGRFERVFSIEVEPKLYAAAVAQFAADPSIEILFGDSGEVLRSLIERPELAGKPILFWLDGHFSGGNTGKASQDTPILQELAVLLTRDCGDRILIDDAHSFGVEKDYPNLAALNDWVRQRRPDLGMKVTENIIALSQQDNL